MTLVEDLQQQPTWPLIVSLARLDNARRVFEASAELLHSDGRLLWLLTDGRERTMSEIADELVLDISTVSRQVTAAVRQGLIRRSRRPGRSAHTVTATDAGMERFVRDADRNLALHRAALAALPQQQREQFVQQLQVFVDAYIDAATEPADAG